MYLLWTDRFFLSMLLIVLILSLISLRHYPARRTLQGLFQRPLAIASGIVLFFFLSIGVLDSIHFKVEKQKAGTSELMSILDKILAPVGTFYEKTYSAPLALTLYSTETVIKNGQVQQIYPRLKFPPLAIQTEQQKWQAIFALGVKALLGSLISTALMGLIVNWCKRGQRFNRNGWIGLTTFFFCTFFVMLCYLISRQFHLFGTGKIGQDIFYYTVKSIHTGLIIGTLTTLFMLPLALIFGLSAGYFGGFIDDVIQYIYTTLSSIPGVLLITASVLSMQTYIANHPHYFSTLEKSADARLLALCLILGVTSWTSLCRLLRAEALKYREIDFVLAAKALGTPSWRILYKHLLPNMMPIVLITLVLDFSFLVLAEAVLSYVGVGVSPTTISWGNMINGARLELAREPLVWWPMLAAFLLMFILVLASNLFSDAVRDALDPHQQL